MKLAVALMLAAIAVAATAGTARADIRIQTINYNPPGADTSAKLNQEWVSIHNYGHEVKALGRWTLRDHQHHVFTFPQSFALCGGCSVRVHTGKGTDGAANLYWGSGAYIWNNTGDIAGLRNSVNQLVDQCKYAGGDTAKAC